MFTIAGGIILAALFFAFLPLILVIIWALIRIAAALGLVALWFVCLTYFPVTTGIITATTIASHLWSLRGTSAAPIGVQLLHKGVQLLRRAA